MKNQTVAGIHLYYDAGEQAASHQISLAVEKSVQLLEYHWQLHPPKNCRVYIMTDWQRFFFQSTHWTQKFLGALSYPLLANRARTAWPFIGGWSFQFGTRKVVGVKSPRIYVETNTSIGEKIYTKGLDIADKIGMITCHELTHAFTFHLHLPTWLQEGIATLAMDRFLGKPVIREDTLEILSRIHPGAVKGKVQMHVENPDLMVNTYTSGYWLTRFIDETRNDILKDLLSRRSSRKTMEQKIAKAYGIAFNSMWEEMIKQAQTHFQKRPEQVG